jgi:hypothetical protein
MNSTKIYLLTLRDLSQLKEDDSVKISKNWSVFERKTQVVFAM